jgi:hypothetical protein
MSESPIPIFPDGAAASTVTATVWIGVVFVVWTNLRFGWCMSGLVVPGYLVPLMLVRPTSVAVMLFEAVVTYLLVHGLSEPFRNRAYWSSFFGRDRFFALVVMSVAVRVLCDGYFFPHVGAYVNERYGLNFNYHDEMHSVGLVVVALIANYFWKPGLVRGAGPLALTVLATFCVVQYFLIPYTSFDVSNLRYVYEDIASSLLASPKAYMVLLTTAYLASHMNLRFSWEYNGILIPALTALLWCEPTKILATFVESIIILLVACLVLKLPMLRQMNIQGSRKVLLFFTVAFLYRLALSWISSTWMPDLKATDLYGFGYLLSTLLANRFHEKGHAMRAIVATTSVALGGALAGSLIGYLLLLVPDPFSQSAIAAESNLDRRESADLREVVGKDKLRLYAQEASRQYVRVTPTERRAFVSAVRSLLDQPDGDRAMKVRELSRKLKSIAYEVLLFEGKYAYFREQAPSRGRGMLVLNLDRPDGLMVSVPHPLREPYALESGFCLFRDLDAGSLAIAGASPSEFGESVSVPGDWHYDLFYASHRNFGQRKVLQIRGYTDVSATAFGVSDAAQDEFIDRGQSQLWISGGLPHDIQLRALQQAVGAFNVRWESAPIHNVSRDLVVPGFAELYLSRRVRTSLFSRFVVNRSTRRNERMEQSNSTQFGHVARWLLDRKITVAAAGSQRYVPAKLEELLMLDQEVLQPLLRLLRDPRGEDRERVLRVINAAASQLDYTVFPFHDTAVNKRYLILAENAAFPRCWGTYVFAEHPRMPFIWEVPRPIIELNSYEFAADAFGNSNSIAFLTPGAHLRANRDGAADVHGLSNKLTLYNLVHQALLREYNNQAALVVQSRAMKDPVDADVVLTTDENARSPADLSPLKSLLADEIGAGRLNVAFVDGSPEFAGYELGNTAEWISIQQASGIELVSAWLSPILRWQYRQQSQNEPLLAQVSALGIPTVETDVLSYLQGRMELTATQAPSRSQVQMVELACTYLHTRDIVVLQELTSCAHVQQIGHLVDASTQQAFLYVETQQDGHMVINLAELRTEVSAKSVLESERQTTLSEFIESRAPIFVQGDAT